MSICKTNFSYCSCGAGKLYDESSFPEDIDVFRDVSARDSSGEYVCALFPRYAYHRPFDSNEITAPSNFVEILKINREIINAGQKGAASALFHISNAIIRDRVIYIKEDHKYLILYETYRPCDRHNSSLATHEELDAAAVGASDGEICYFMGSTGCFNYGHWLSDDLVKISAFWRIRALHPSAHIYIILTAHNGKIDEIKAESIRFFLSRDANFSIRYFARPVSVAFKGLYYASPASYPGVLKSPEATSYLHIAALEALSLQDPFVASSYISPRDEHGKRIFVDRGLHQSRGLINSKQIFDILKKRGFIYINPEDLSFFEQVRIFSKADFVIGNMGAGMTNTIFCRPGSRVLHLAPEGWDDAFFWDLAYVMNHRHRAIYGRPTNSSNLPSYEVDPDVVDHVAGDLC